MRPRFSLHLAAMLFILGVAGAFMTLLASETPYGAVAGELRTAETGAALPNVEVSLIKANHSPAYSGLTDAAGKFHFRHVAVGRYTLMAKTKAHEQPREPLVVEEGKTLDAVFELKPTAPYLRILQTQKIFTTMEEPKIRCMGFVPAENLSVQLFQVAPEIAQKKWSGWLPEALSLNGRKIEDADLATVPGLKSVAHQTFHLKARDIEGVFRDEIPLGKQPPGMYLATFEADSTRALALVTVTDLGLIVKAAPGETLVFAVNLQTGEPMPGTSVSMVQQSTSQTVPAAPLATATTDAQGLATLHNPPSTSEEERAVLGRAGASMALATFYSRGSADQEPLRVYTYTDRPVYRPGQTVFFKSMARELVGDAYRVPPSVRVDLRVMDEGGNLVYAGQASANAYGSFSGQFDLNPSAIPGNYTLTVGISGHNYESNFRVAEYRKPEFEVKVTPERKRYIVGDTVKATVEARYYYGAAASGAAVDYTVTRSPSWYEPELSEWDEDLSNSTGDNPDASGGEFEGGGDSGGEVIAEGTGVTDAEGHLSITVPPPKKPTQAKGTDTSDLAAEDWQYNIQATVTDASRREESGNSNVLVTQGEFRLEGSVADSVAKPGQRVEVAIQAVDYEGKPIAGATGEAVLARAHWENSEEKLEEVSRTPWQAGPDGKAALTVWPPQDGDYRVILHSQDRRGNEIAHSIWLWVMGEDEASFAYPYQDLDLHADKSLYKEGDTAEIVVNTKHAPQTVLMTVEGNGILERRIVRLAGKSTRLTVKIGPEDLPAARVNLCFFRDKQFLSGDAVLRVSRQRKALKVEVKSEKATYGPGEKAVYHVKTLSPEGKPVSAEVSLGVVDEAIYAIAPDLTENIVSYFYPQRVDVVQTSFSSPEVYLSGDDKAKISLELKAQQETVRRNFQDTAFWRPSAVTDDKGDATLEFALPDNLTSWRATCRASTLDSRMGQAKAETVVKKPFLVRLEAPRFFNQGDEATVSALANNLTDDTLTAKVSLQAPGMEVRGQPEAEVRVGPGQTQRVEWTVVGNRLGGVPITVRANAGTLSDAMELTLPVQPKGRERTAMHSDSLDARNSFAFDVRQDAIPGTRQLTLRLSPSLASALLGSLDYLATYPYGCAEQTMSSFLPDVILAQMLRKLGLARPDLEKKLPGMVKAGLLKLYGFQHPDGGWRWWTYDDTDPWMTAYVVFGLLQARQAGYDVTPRALENGIAALKTMAETPKKIDADTQAYMAYVLALAGETNATVKTIGRLTQPKTGEPYASLSDWGRAFLALALAKEGKAAEGQALLQTVWGHFIGSDFMPQKAKEWRSDAEYGAVLLSAATELTPTEPRLPALVRWLLDRRKADHWDSTRDTAFALYALSRYLPLTGELQPNMRVKVLVKGRVVLDRPFTAADLAKPEVELTLNDRDLPPGKVEVALEKTGKGRLYYTASLSQYTGIDLQTPLRSDSGLLIERSYRKLSADEKRQSYTPEGGPSGGGSERAFNPGDVVEVTLTIRSRGAMDYLMVEDPLPAGFETRDRGNVEPWEWANWWADQVTRDNKVGFAVRHLEPGVRRITYRIVAQNPGAFTALPPLIYDMYNPDTRSEGIADAVRVGS